jgi:Fic family protein
MLFMFKPIYRITPHLLKLVDEAGFLRSWIESATIKVPWLPRMQNESRAKTAHFSTSIEGNSLSLAQVQNISSGGPISCDNNTLEIRNYLAVMKWIEANYIRPINGKNILFLHKKLMNGLMPDGKCGKFKDKQNYIINEKGIRIYTPPTPKETPAQMHDLLAWLNSKSALELHSVVVSAIMHHRLVSIHPPARVRYTAYIQPG